MNIKIYMNDVYIPHKDKKQFVQIYYGGSSSGKSYFLAQKIVLDNLSGVNWLCCRNVARTIRNSTFNEITKAIWYMGLGQYYSINKSDMVITCQINGKQILFAGLDNVEKLKSITPAKGILERVFVEEATEIKRDSFMQLKKRLRGVSNFSKCIILAFNPVYIGHWIHKDFFGSWQDDKNIYEDNDLLILKTTYKDNKFLTKDDIRLLEDESDPYFHNVYSLGNWGVLGHVIFRNWHVEDLSNQYNTFDNLYFGGDFGYSSDPNALIKVHYDRARKKIYVLDEFYKTGMNDEELSRVYKKFVGDNFVTSDSSEQKTIDFLNLNGTRVIPAVKGADSINRGIRWLQGHEIIVDVHCQNFKNEIETYHWLEDKYGNAMAKAVDRDNHLLDSLRYSLETLINSHEASSTRRV